MRKDFRKRAAVLACGFVMAAAVSVMPQSPFVMRAEAHHSSSHCGRGSTAGTGGGRDYYYCGGHSAHHHQNGVCPYGQTAAQSGTRTPSAGGTGSGWHHEDDHWGYRCDDGTSLSNCWQQIDGNWYCFDGQGCMRTGWYNEDGCRYYLGTDGRMVTGSALIGSGEYKFDENGKLIQ